MTVTAGRSHYTNGLKTLSHTNTDYSVLKQYHLIYSQMNMQNTRQCCMMKIMFDHLVSILVICATCLGQPQQKLKTESQWQPENLNLNSHNLNLNLNLLTENSQNTKRGALRV